MPPKSENVSRKKKKPTEGEKSEGAVDVLSMEDMSKEQLEEHVIRLREELEREREERTFFQLERDKIQSSWEVSKRLLEETRAQLGTRSREKDDADRRHRIEINVYKQKLKHVLSEQRAAAADEKMRGGAVAWLARGRHAEAELRLRRHAHDEQAEARRDKLAGHKCVRELKLKHQVALMELSNNYDKRIAEVEAKYAEKMEQMREAESHKTQAALSTLEDKMSRRLRSLADRRRQTSGAAREFFGATQSKLLHDGKTLRAEASAAATCRARAEVRLDEAEKRNGHLAASLREAERNLPGLRRRLEGHRRAHSQQAAGAARVKQLEERLEELVLERDLLIAAFEQVEEERDALLMKQTQVLLEVQQRSGLKEMLLDRKMALLSRSVDKTEAQLLAALAADGTAPADKLGETLESKRATIRTLQEDLDRQCHEYAALAGTCRHGLDALGVPSYQFPLADVPLVLGQHAH
ncbi:dynein regulatory complex subunit 4-like [Syngnathus acus]|uniref:dynein regulatory complex subunit 4-like n=1 Tax=Syngnathus acus TaxID=161584 RepID=UPI0018863619|nr:dynein regulatory complex subunit 4-like [Syngnathus acus]